MTTHRVTTSLLLLTALLATAWDTSADEATTHVYRIGNSLTWDSKPRGVDALAEQAGRRHLEAWHINCGASLEKICRNPEQVCVEPREPYGKFREALTRHQWDAVAMQPYPGKQSTLATDTRRIIELIGLARQNPANAQTRFYIYAAWPGKSAPARPGSSDEGSYAQSWLREIPDEDDSPTRLCRAYFAHLLRRVNEASDVEVGMIPAGEVLFELDRQMRAGDVPSYSDVYQLYRDQPHLNSVGRFAAGLTTLVVLEGVDPTAITKPSKHYGPADAFSPELYRAIQRTVRRECPAASNHE